MSQPKFFSVLRRAHFASYTGPPDFCAHCTTDPFA